LDAHERDRVEAALAAAGARARAGAPLARLSMEPAGDHAAVALTVWPGGAQRLLAEAGYHGSPVRWVA
jgi:hypothetical protein